VKTQQEQKLKRKTFFEVFLFQLVKTKVSVSTKSIVQSHTTIPQGSFNLERDKLERLAQKTFLALSSLFSLCR
jgi:hypothetical protein